MMATDHLGSGGVAVVVDSEAASADERQPLLPSYKVVNQGDHIPVDPSNDSDVPTSDLEPNTDAAKSPLRPSTIVFYCIIALLGILMLVVLIKGIIDAGNVEFDLGDALKKALGGGLSGAAAMVLQVLTLMPLRTVMNYQYRYGTTTSQAIRILYADGGWTRYYQGLSAALIQGPTSRFGDTAANAGILAFLQSNPYMRNLPAFIQTVFASAAAAAFRIILTPVDTVKTTLQAQGRRGLSILRTRVKAYGISSMWYGALATAAATFVGHYPWFATYNTLSEILPLPQTVFQKLLRQAFIGFTASVISDTVSNSLRVVKTYRQVNETRIGYVNAAKEVIRVDGLSGLFGRGLKTRIIANGCQGLMFSVLWKLFQDMWDNRG